MMSKTELALPDVIVTGDVIKCFFLYNVTHSLSYPLTTLLHCPIIGSGSDAVLQDVAERKHVSLFAQTLEALFNVASHATFLFSL